MAFVFIGFMADVTSGKDSHNHQRLLFSLAQIEYLQYYIHELRLTDPKVARSIVNAETAPDAEEGEDEDEKVEEWIPLLLTLMRPEEFASIVSLTNSPLLLLHSMTIRSF